MTDTSAGYINIPIETDPDSLAQMAFDHLQTKWPDWEPRDPQLATWIITAIARIAAELRDVASDVPASIFRWFGTFMVNFPPLDAIEATGSTTWTMRDSAGYFVPAGTVVGIRDSLGNLQPFETTEDFNVPTGSTATSPGFVTIAAIEPGIASSQLAGPVVELIDALDYIDSISLIAPTQGGQDAEDDLVYLNRLRSRLQLMSDQLIDSTDYATDARLVAGEGYRAYSLNGYNPVDGTFGNEKHIATWVRDEAGLAAATTVKDAIVADFESKREVNYTYHVLDAIYTAVDVQFDVLLWPGWDPVSVKANIIAALQAFLSPSAWGQPPFGDQQIWYNKTKVINSDLIRVVGSVDGVDDVLTVTARTGTDAYGTADINLPGVAPLPLVGAIDGTVATP